MKKKIDLTKNKYVKEMQKSWELLIALKDKNTFDKLTVKEKLEALRISAMQR